MISRLEYGLSIIHALDFLSMIFENQAEDILDIEIILYDKYFFHAFGITLPKVRRLGVD